jgi:hypothetical protein
VAPFLSLNRLFSPSFRTQTRRFVSTHHHPAPRRFSSAALKMAASFPPLPSLPSHASPETSALDTFKLATAAFVSNTLEIPLAQAFEGVESGKTGKNVQGDFLVAVPRYRLKGKPQEYADKLVKEVSCVWLLD